MTTKERLHELVDELTEAEADETLQLVVARRQGRNGTDIEPAQPGDVIDEWGNLSAMTRHAAGDLMRRLDEEEIAEFGETISEAWGYESPK